MAVTLFTASVALSIISTARESSQSEVVAALLLDAFRALQNEFRNTDISAPSDFTDISQRSSLIIVLGAPLVLPLLIRLALAVAILFHEWMHLVLASVLLFKEYLGTSFISETAQSSTWNNEAEILQPHDSFNKGDILPTKFFEGLRRIWSKKNMCGNINSYSWIDPLHPYSRLPWDFTPHVRVPSFNDHSSTTEGMPQHEEKDKDAAPHSSETIFEDSFVRLGAWFLSCIAFLACLAMCLDMWGNVSGAAINVTSPNDWMSGQILVFKEAALMKNEWGLVLLQCLTCGLGMAAVGCTATDAFGLGGQDSDTCGGKAFFCGNFGMILQCAAKDVRKAAFGAMEILEEMAAISSERGGQSGGLVTLLHNGESIRGMRERVMPGKRDSLSKKLLGRFRVRMFLHFIWAFFRSLPLALINFHKMLFKGTNKEPLNDSSEPTSVPDIESATSINQDNTNGAHDSCTLQGVSALQSGEAHGATSEKLAVQVFAGHTRFATSSIPSANETHPHQWCPRRPVRIWRVDSASGIPQLAHAHSDIYITHNGDFEFYNLYGRDRTHSELGPWLEIALGVPQPAHCDSVMIAGLMDLLRTKGIWSAALRLAYHQAVMMSFEEMFATSTPVPFPGFWDALGKVADSTFHSFVDKWHSSRTSGCSFEALLSPPGAKQELEQELVDALRSPDTRDILQRVCSGHTNRGLPSLLQDLSLRALEAMVAQALHNFCSNDVFASVQTFFSKAKGSFGMSVCSGLDSDRVVLSALNQPLSVGFAPSAAAVLFSSESFSLTVPLPAYFQSKVKQANHTPSTQGEDENTRDKKGSSDVVRVEYRLDLDEGAGEVLEILMTAPETHSTQVMHGRFSLSPIASAREDVNAPAPHMNPTTRDQGHSVSVSRGGPLAHQQQEFLHLPELQGICLRLHCVRSGQMLIPEELRSRRRLVCITENPGITLKMPKDTSMDLVAHDLKDTSRVLERIRRDWQEESSLNRQTAAALVGMLKAKAAAASQERNKSNTSHRAIDVLVTGVECSLWVGEQFAADLQNCFPQLRVVPMSANKVIGVMGNARGAISTSGFSFCRMVSSLSPTEAIVIAISQSGQTFPTLHATRILAKHCPGRVFVCVGMLDSKMASAMGHSLDASAPPSCRVFHTHSGWRSAEPASASVAAAHATLTELLLHAARELREDADKAPAPPTRPLTSSAGGGEEGEEGVEGEEGEEGAKESKGQVQVRPLGLRLSGRDIGDLERMRDAAVLQSVPDITGWDWDGKKQKTVVHQELRAQGLQWAMHIMETPLAWVLSAVYIFATVILGHPIFTAIRKGAHWEDHTWLAYLLLALDSAVYLFLPLIMALLLRILFRRQLLARIGKRTLVIADVPYVHQVLEEFVSKLFALSFWIASIDVHGANPIDHFVHRFTHRVTRGTLIAVGRPDGRMCSQTKCESWVLMALLQARTIVNLGGTGAEAITVGHNPYTNPVLIKKHLALPSNRPKFLCEKMLGVDEDEPQKRMASRAFAVTAGTGKNTFAALDSDVVGMHLCDEGTVEKARQRGLAMMAHGMGMPVTEEDADDPSNREVVLCGMQMDVQKLIHSQVALEDFCENRFLSLERLLAFQVTFHRMASAVASLPLINFDITRSQSRLRIATTAAPVSAADLEREWLDSMADASVYQGFRHVNPSSFGEGSTHRLGRNSSMHRMRDAVQAMFLHKGSGLSQHGHRSHHGNVAHSHHGAFLLKKSPGESLHDVNAGQGGKISPQEAVHSISKQDEKAS